MAKRLLLFTTFAVLVRPAGVLAQAKPFGIVDNSFLVEEAFNQDKGTFQNIFSWTRSDTGDWEGSFTQEWPAPVTAHQLSYTVPFAGGGSPTHFGGVLISYRYQVLNEGPGRPAFAPRFSVILPTGDGVDASNHPGLQVNLPFSKQVGALYMHGNAGFTWLHGVPLGPTARDDLTTPHIAGSLVWNTRPFFNLMIESDIEFEDAVRVSLVTSREAVVTVSPGFRGGWNVGVDRQMIVGAALPITSGEDRHTVAFLTYFSYELPFSANR